MVNDVGSHVLPMLERERVADDELYGDRPSCPRAPLWFPSVFWLGASVGCLGIPPGAVPSI